MAAAGNVSPVPVALAPERERGSPARLAEPKRVALSERKRVRLTVHAEHDAIEPDRDEAKRVARALSLPAKAVDGRV